MDLQTLKALLDTVVAIRTPLMFWSFCALLAFFSFREFSRRNDWFRELASSVTGRLEEANLYRLARLSVGGFLVVLVLTITLAFFSPLADKWLERRFAPDDVSALIDEFDARAEDRTTRVLDALDLSGKYLEVVDAYEAREYEAAFGLAREVFAVGDRAASDDELHGLVIAAYDGAGRPDECAREVLVRDRGRNVWDRSLWPDLAWCMRRHALAASLPACLELAEDLIAEFGGKLASRSWCVLRLEDQGPLRDGVHAVQDWKPPEVERDLTYVADRFPDDPHRDVALYSLGRYDEVLDESPDSHLRDLLLFASGYEIVRELDAEIGPRRGSRYYDVPIDAALTPEQRQRAARAISLLERYVEEFPDRPQADDAAHWLGWLEAARGRVEASLAWLGRVRSLGNGDYAQSYGFSRALSFNIILETRGLTDALPLLPEADRRWVIDGYLLKAHQALHRFRVDSARVMLDEVRTAAETTGAPVAGDEIALLESTLGIVDAARRAGSMEAYASAASRLRRELFERHVAAGVAEEGLGRFSDDPDRDRLHYLKIVAMREIWPDSVEASVRAFLARFPESGLADDALAELVYVKAYALAQPDEARDFLLLLEERFPAGNALDNASNWVALGYRELCENPWRGRAVEDPCGMAQEMYSRITADYAHTRFAPIARDELTELAGEIGG